MRNGKSQNTFSSTRGRLGSLSPKTVVAVVLMTLMGVLWLRVLLGGSTSPTEAQAAEALSAAEATRSAAPVEVLPVALPVVQGRNDTLCRDVFSADGWSGFGQSGKPTAAATTVSEDNRRLAAFFASLEKTLHLDAILHEGGRTQGRACIDGKVLSQGQSVTVSNGQEEFTLTLSKIGEHQVVLTWGQWEVVLKMAQSEHTN